MTWVELLIAAGTGGAGLVVGAWAIRQRVRAVGEHTVRNEWQELAKVRGENIADMEQRIRSLEERLAHLEGAYAGLQDLKANQIADRVVERLVASRMETP